jgi:hypothetical protein
MSALEASIESLTAEHATLTQKLEQIDQQYRVERPVVVSQISQLAKALSALTGKPVAGPIGQIGRKPMSAEGKAAIKAGLERARAAKQAGAPVQKGAEVSSVQPKVPAPAAIPAKRDVTGEKLSTTR